MNHKKRRQNGFLAFFIITILSLGSFLSLAQDIPPADELSLGSSVFIFRGANKAAQKKYSAANASNFARSKTQRVASRQKISRQYNALAKVTARRESIKPVAAEALPELLRKTPKEAAVALTGAGIYYFKRGEVDKSIGYFRQANDLDAANQDAKFGLSDALVSKGDQSIEADDFDKARFYYQDAVKYNDKNSAAYSGLGEVFDAQKDNDKAIANYEKALQLDKDLTEIYPSLGVLYFKKGEIAKADDLLTKAIAAHSDDAETQYFLGLVRYQQNRYQDALAAFGQAAKSNAESADAYFYLGETYDKLDRENDAIAAYQTATKLDPKYVNAWFALGVLNYNRKNFADALSAYQQVTRLQNTNGDAHANLADTFLKMDRLGEAEGEYRLATAFIKNDAELYSKFGYVLGRQSKWSSSIDALNKALALSPDAIDYTNLGWAYYNWAQLDLNAKRDAEAKTKLQAARDALQKAVAMNANLAPASLNLGVTLNDLEQYREAIAPLKRAAELRPKWVFAVNELGRAYRYTNDFDDAAKQFRKAVELDDKFAIGYYNLGETEFRRGNVKEARKAQEKLKTLNKNLANALEVLLIGAVKK